MAWTEGMNYQETVTMVTIECCNCGIVFGMPSSLQKVLLADSSKGFYCPHGHKQYYSKSTEVILKEKLEAQRIENERQQRILQDKIITEQREKEKLQKQIKRVHKGVCPCCNRSFQNLKRHLETKHPELVKKNPIAPIIGLIGKK